MRFSSRRAMWSLLFLAGFLIVSGCSRASGSFTDDFSDPASGWGAASHETYVRGYQQGRYLIQIDVPRWFVWATAGRRYEDVSLTATVRTMESLDNHFGMICRYEDGDYYYFAISSDGYYAIFKKLGDADMEALTGDFMQKSPAIRSDGSENTVRAICQGKRLSLYANGPLLAEVEDDSFSKGDVGLAAGTVAQGGTIVWFDDLKVEKP